MALRSRRWGKRIFTRQNRLRHSRLPASQPITLLLLSNTSNTSATFANASYAAHGAEVEAGQPRACNVSFPAAQRRVAQQQSAFRRPPASTRPHGGGVLEDVLTF